MSAAQHLIFAANRWVEEQIKYVPLRLINRYYANKNMKEFIDVMIANNDDTLQAGEEIYDFVSDNIDQDNLWDELEKIYNKYKDLQFMRNLTDDTKVIVRNIKTNKCRKPTEEELRVYNLY
jgi:hypothetical protein